MANEKALRIISGGQTGADQAGWRAAKRFGLIGDFGGWMPKGFKTESGNRPEFATLYNAREHFSPLYPPRTEENAGDSDATIWLGSVDSRGFACTINACKKYERPYFVSTGVGHVKPDGMAKLIQGFNFKIVNIAGNRESSAPGIGLWAEEFLCEMFRAMGYKEVA